jgi:hypothetical protein
MLEVREVSFFRDSCARRAVKLIALVAALLHQTCLDNHYAAVEQLSKSIQVNSE